MGRYALESSVLTKGIFICSGPWEMRKNTLSAGPSIVIAKWKLWLLNCTLQLVEHNYGLGNISLRCISVFLAALVRSAFPHFSLLWHGFPHSHEDS